jgi:predicted alpha/beta-fold hydrolase
MPYQDRPIRDKLADARIPVLIVHAANDPLVPAQDIADFVAGVNNPQVSAIILPGGGHVGFAPYAKAYTFSLMRNFFDPRVGAAGTDRVKSQQVKLTDLEPNEPQTSVCAVHRVE